MSHRLLPALPVASAARSVAHELFPLQHCSCTCRMREMMLQLLELDNIASEAQRFIEQQPSKQPCACTSAVSTRGQEPQSMASNH